MMQAIRFGQVDLKDIKPGTVLKSTVSGRDKILYYVEGVRGAIKNEKGASEFGSAVATISHYEQDAPGSKTYTKIPSREAYDRQLSWLQTLSETNYAFDKVADKAKLSENGKKLTLDA